MHGFSSRCCSQQEPLRCSRGKLRLKVFVLISHLRQNVTMKTNRIIAALLITVGMFSAAAQEAIPENPSASADALNKRMEAKAKEVEERYKGRLAAIQMEGQEVADDEKQPIKFDVTVRWKDRKMSLDLPQVTMKNKDIKFDVPQVEMKMDSIVFNTPSVRMKRVKVGQHPEIHGFTVRWKDNFIDVPEPFMQRQEIKTKIPQFAMGTTRIVLKVPEVKIDRTDFVMKVPELFVDQINLLIPVSQGGNKKKIEHIKEEAEKLAAEMQADMMKEVAAVRTDASKAAAASAAAADAANSEAITKVANQNAEEFQQGTKDAAQFITENGQKLDGDTLKKLTDDLKAMSAAQQAGSEQILKAVEELKKQRATFDETLHSAEKTAPK